jgi:hypothetical protein
LFTAIEKNPKMYTESQKNPNSQSNAGGIIIPDFKLYYIVLVEKVAWYWHKNRHTDLWNRIENEEINSCSYSHLILNKDAKNIC